MLAYVKWKGNNFGDELNDQLFPQRFGIREFKYSEDVLPTGTFVLGIGTILNSQLRPSNGARLIVFGSGTGYNNNDNKINIRGHALFVRGPLTCDFLGLKRSLAITDGAYALTEQFRAAAAPAQEFDSGLIPHHRSLEHFPKNWENKHGMHLISPYLPFADFVREVSRCRRVVSECMHGAITADILGIPFLVLQTTPAFHSFKWLDWTASLGMPLVLQYRNPLEITPASMKHARFQLSEERRREDAIVRIAEKADELDEILKQFRAKEA